MRFAPGPCVGRLMERMRVRRQQFGFPALAILASLVLSGCLVTSVSPIGTTAPGPNDPLITGMWKGTGSDNVSVYIGFFPHRNGSLMAVMLQAPSAADDGGWSTFALRTAKLGANHYIDAQQIEQDGKPAETKLGHVPVLYTINSDGRLALYMMDETRTKQAISSGKIRGTVEPGQFGDATITASPARVDAFLRTETGHALFNKPFVMLERLR